MLKAPLKRVMGSCRGCVCGTVERWGCGHAQQEYELACVVDVVDVVTKSAHVSRGRSAWHKECTSTRTHARTRIHSLAFSKFERGHETRTWHRLHAATHRKETGRHGERESRGAQDGHTSIQQ
jgi:hypothetical protein